MARRQNYIREYGLVVKLIQLFLERKVGIDPGDPFIHPRPVIIVSISKDGQVLVILKQNIKPKHINKETIIRDLEVTIPQTLEELSVNLRKEVLMNFSHAKVHISLK